MLKYRAGKEADKDEKVNAIGFCCSGNLLLESRYTLHKQEIKRGAKGRVSTKCSGPE